MKPNFAVTEEIVRRLVPAMAEAGLEGITLEINGEHQAGDFDQVDDEIRFVLPDGTRSDLDIQAGPYGLGVNKSIYEDGKLTGVLGGKLFEQFQIDQLVAEAIAKLSEAHPPAAAPKL